MARGSDPPVLGRDWYDAHFDTALEQTVRPDIDRLGVTAQRAKPIPRLRIARLWSFDPLVTWGRRRSVMLTSPRGRSRRLRALRLLSGRCAVAALLIQQAEARRRFAEILVHRVRSGLPVLPLDG